MPWLGAQGRVSWVLGLDGPCSCHVGAGLPGPRWQLPVWREHRDVCRVQDSSVRPDEASASAAGPRAPSAAGRTPRDVSQLVLGAGLRRPRTPRPIHRFCCMAFRQLPGLASKHGCCCGHSGRAPRAHAGAPACDRGRGRGGTDPRVHGRRRSLGAAGRIISHSSQQRMRPHRPVSRSARGAITFVSLCQ